MVSDLGAAITFHSLLGGKGPFRTSYKTLTKLFSLHRKSKFVLAKFQVCCTPWETPIHTLLPPHPPHRKSISFYSQSITLCSPARTLKISIALKQQPAFNSYAATETTITLKMNISRKLQKLDLSNKTREEILRDIFSKPKDPLWKESFQFQE
ncbi:unnamed protein product [Pocillopora meandrina]|uniref:Uncharacterized protein n=1 Tax=Pocillopora meandrina TaxID=46732 RepID=A0AAU9VNF9_9CNID|nr:unnamed protein product [Pocillopora meandrina]